MKKSTIFLMLSFLFSIVLLNPATAQSGNAYNAKDIEGIWRHPSGYELKIKDNQARIFTVNDSGVPKKLITGVFYDEIKHLDGNEWSAVFYQWRYSDNNKQDGRWVKIGTVTITMDTNKKWIKENTRSFERMLE